MKKIVFYIPAILCGLGMLFVKLIGLNLSPIHFIWLALFTAGALLYVQSQFRGGVLGALPGIHLVIMSTRYTGQVIDIERPVGIFLIVFYAVCSIYVLRKSGQESEVSK